MKDFARQALIFGITLVILIGVFWFVLPMLGLNEIFGPAYTVFVLAGSLGLSILISRLLSRVIK